MNINTRVMNQIPFWNVKRTVGTAIIIKVIHPIIRRCVIIHHLYKLIVFIVCYSKLGPFNDPLPMITACRQLRNVPLDAWLSGYGFQAVAGVVGGHGT